MREFICMMLLAAGVCEAGDQRFSVSLSGSYTTNARFLYNINRPDIYVENNNFGSNFGIGGDIRWNLSDDEISIGISTEKVRTLQHSTSLYQAGGRFIRVPVEEGLTMIPVELTGYFVVPISTEDIRFYLGGGIGVYYGERQYAIGGVKAATLNSPSGFGIHVVTEVEYRIFSFTSVRAELKFRDPQFDSVNSFDQPSTIVSGARIQLDQTPTTTRVNLNGITYGVGIVFAL